MTPVLELRDVSRCYDDGAGEVAALSSVSLSVAAGELVAVMGPSGSGKSTLLQLAGGLDRPTDGHVLVDGRDLADLSTRALAALRRRRVGYVFQRLNLLASLTAVENVMLPLELDGIGARGARAAAEEALAQVGFSGSTKRFPDDLSGGEQQRVAIARGVVGERALLLADEPTGALDTVGGEAILELLSARRDAGAAVVLVTHEPRFAGWADRVLFLRDGQVVDEAVARSGAATLASRR
ncbi:MAG: putative transport system ATP-binding protein [Solirubrobacteraceae bacterium]|jgi:putative ABC transport system ATP-binding protein|nr:putative transport system ATP-binding protein [Solirubrobacteraceae bacterium]